MTKSLFHLHLLFTKTYGSSRTSFVQLIKTLIKKVFPHPSATQHAYASLYRLHNKIAYSIRWLTLAPERATDNTRHLLHLSKTNPLPPTLLKSFDLITQTPAAPFRSSTERRSEGGASFRWHKHSPCFCAFRGIYRRHLKKR